MPSLYLFALLVGGALLLFSVVGGSDHGHHHAGVGHSGHGSDGGDGHDSHDSPYKFLSLRTLTYFMFVFGGVGTALSWAWKSAASPVIFTLAAAAGVGIAGLVGASFAYLAKTDSGARDSEESFVGLSGKMLLPIGSGGMGKVLVHRGDRTYELLARPLDSSVAGTSEWKSVIVVEMSRGTALVAPLDDNTLTDGS